MTAGKTTMMNFENIIMDLIVRSGEAKSLAFEALSQARSGDFVKAEQMLAESRDAGRQAHKIQTRLITMDGEGKDIPLSLMMVHAQDHLMGSMLAQDLIEEMIQLYQKVDK